MGRHYRSSEYHKFVLFSGRTVKDGEAMVVWDRLGRQKEIIGPHREWLFNSTVRFLDRHKAESHQYLRVKFRDGRVEHIRGPTNLYENPVLHDKITVHAAIRLTSNNACIIVYKNSMTSQATKEGALKDGNEEKSNGESSKRIVTGPTIFFPEPNEYVHTFQWESESEPFQVLPLSHCSFVNDDVTISTTDGFSFDASLVFDYHVESVDKVTFTDPLKKMQEGLLADSQALGNSYPSQSLRNANEQKKITAELAKLETYPQLNAAASKCGIQIDSLKLTKISLCPTLQKQIDSEQKLEASLRSELKQKSEGRKIKELELEEDRKKMEGSIELERIKMEKESELNEKTHQIKLAALEKRVELARREAQANQSIEKIENEAKLNFLNELGKMGVDMTQFLTAQKKSDPSQKKTAQSVVEEVLKSIDYKANH